MFRCRDIWDPRLGTTDDGNLCHRLLLSGTYSCVTHFCPDCDFGGLCDETCGYCFGENAEHEFCDNAYDDFQGRGSCNALLASGLSCETDFCHDCRFAGFCSDSCSLCDASLPPTASLLLQRDLAATAAHRAATAASAEGEGDGASADGAAGGEGGADALSPVGPDLIQEPANGTEVSRAPKNISFVSQWCLWFGTSGKDGTQEEQEGASLDGRFAASEVVDDNRDAGAASEVHGMHSFCQPPTMWIVLLPAAGFVLCAAFGFCYGCCCIDSDDRAAMSMVGVGGPAAPGGRRRDIGHVGRRGSTASMASISSLSSQSSLSSNRKHYKKKEKQAQRMQNENYDTVNPLYPGRAEGYDPRAFDLETPPRSPPNERDYNHRHGSFRGGKAPRPTREGFVENWDARASTKSDREIDAIYGGGSGGGGGGRPQSSLEFRPTHFQSVIHDMSVGELRDSCRGLHLPVDSTTSVDAMRDILVRYYAGVSRNGSQANGSVSAPTSPRDELIGVEDGAGGGIDDPTGGGGGGPIPDLREDLVLIEQMDPQELRELCDEQFPERARSGELTSWDVGRMRTELAEQLREELRGEQQVGGGSSRPAAAPAKKQAKPAATSKNMRRPSIVNWLV